MAIVLKIENCAAMSVEEDTITLGSDPSCTVRLPPMEGLQPKHAVIRKLAGRWLVEVRGADSISVGDGPPTRLHWLGRGDIIRPVEGCPTITFEPDVIGSTPTPAPRPGGDSVTGGFVRPILRTDSNAPPLSNPIVPVTDALESSKPKSVSISSFETADASIEIKLAAPDEKPARPMQQPKSVTQPKPARPPEPEFAETEAEVVPTKPIKLNSFSGDSQFAATKSRRRNAEQTFWLQFAGGGVLGMVALAVWFLFGPRSSTQSYVDLGPRSNNSDQASGSPQVPIGIAPSRPKPAPATKAPVSPADDDSAYLSMSAPTTDDPKTPVAELPETTAPKKVANPKSGAPPSPAFQLAQTSVFGVYAQHSDQEHCFRVGTAWAASRRHLVTSGAVATTVEELQRQGLTIVVSQTLLVRPLTIKTIRVNPAYKGAVDRAVAARKQLAALTNEPTPPAKNTDEFAAAPDVELARAYADQARFDLGVLEIATGERLKNSLTMESGALPEVGTAEFVMIGLPFDADDYRTDSATNVDEPQERASRARSATKSESYLTLSMEFPDDVADANWSGSPVLDRSLRVIGVYSRATAPVKGKTGALPRRHSVVWLGRLREFAPELE